MKPICRRTDAGGSMNSLLWEENDGDRSQIDKMSELRSGGFV